MLPDDVLLEMFHFYVSEDKLFNKRGIEEWITLAHVCRRWRSVVFQSPHRLNLQLFCTPETPARNILDIWPPLPLIVVSYQGDTSGVDNVIAALEHNDRVCKISLKTSGLGYTTKSVLQNSFPELTELCLGGFVYDEQWPILPDSLLGGAAPRLQLLDLWGVPFPGLPKLLLSATHLVRLKLSGIPPSGYIPPEAMATSLSALTSLELLCLNFLYPRPLRALESRRPPPLTRSILPSLTNLQFKGASEYLEEILARIDVPRLDDLRITFFNQIIFDTPQLFQSISRRPTLRAPDKGHIVFTSMAITVIFASQTSDYGVLRMKIQCAASEWQLSSLEQVCTSSLPPLSTLEDLYIHEKSYSQPRWQNDVENTLWLELLHRFAAVKKLYLCKEFVPRIAPALQELVGGRTTEVLPTLENIFLEGFQPSGPVHKGIEKFVAARQLTGHPVAVSQWDRDSGEEGKWTFYDW